ncbi:ATP-binding cassette, subfamily B [Amycolatopsis australiensis]|uniref:ATP-binding cassette, subfamily B n=2 Tax=Amycolatopsis australiensis TaxID=546364 RepID=A0A1K1QMQ0_9PSEU|nr:ABC transporter ATP-binding protein [Amycolatopsis australiensis]SFW60526.1 ATP-binding cassette, subfamily B [Amycolatopsis australiensis]
MRRPAGTTQDTTDSPPLIGVENLKMPEWARVDERVAAAGFGQAVRALPTAVTVVVRLAWRTSPRLTLLAGFVHVVSGTVTAFGLLATANVFTALLQQGPTPERVLESLPAILVVTGSYAARAALDSAVAAVEGALRPRVTAAADDAVTAAVVRVGLIAFEDADFRELARQGARYGVRAIETSLRRLADLTSSAISLAAAMVTAGLLNPWLAPVLLLAAAADGWAAARVAKLNYRHYIDTVSRNIRKTVVEEVATWRTMALERHALTLQEPLLGEYRRISRSLVREEVRLAHRSNLVRTTGRAAAGAGTAVAYLVLGWLLYSGAMELALAGTAVLAMRTASTALSSTTRAVNSLYEDSFYIGFYNQLLAESRKRRPPATTLAAPADPAEIRLEGVTFTYPGRPSPALRDISLTIRRGEVVALVGENGSGKTTLGKLLTGLYPPDEGVVRWDGVDLAQADPATVHANIAVIAQEPAEWPMTAANNVTVGRLGRPDPDRRAWREAVGCSGADEVIDSLPAKENTVLSKKFDEGQDLSGGQWQRMGIARGIYRDASVLVADEPTAALDARAEARVFAGLQHASTSLRGGRRTTILVTHRLANIRSADRILVLEKGRLIEQGTHEELIRAGGLYHELYEIQARAYRASEAAIPQPRAEDAEEEVSPARTD